MRHLNEKAVVVSTQDELATFRTMSKHARHEDGEADDLLGQESATALNNALLSVRKTLTRTLTNDALRDCGPSVVSRLQSHPDEVTELAHEKLYTWPFADVPLCWRRLYEDASLWKATRGMMQLTQRFSNSKRRCLQAETDDLLDQIVEALDMGITMSGQPARKELFRQAFDALQSIPRTTTLQTTPEFFSIEPPKSLTTGSHVKQVRPNFEEFNVHIHKHKSPLLIDGALDTWPAMQKWSRPAYLLHLTLDGRRLVPVEIGSTYTDDNWTQRIMPFREYMHNHILASRAEKGYLAQHDLLSQIPSLLNDISIPDYCYTCPPMPNKASAQLEAPLMNSWFGPAGTRSPLHTDPYHNILCQVVGYKYVRLYSPEQSAKLYPRQFDEAGINMENTSEVDFAFAERASIYASHPLFVTASYQEVILEPGQCLYIPVGWWHYVESLTISFSVSFWWN